MDEAVPEMPHEHLQKMLDWLQSGPTKEEVREMIPYFKAMSEMNADDIAKDFEELGYILPDENKEKLANLFQAKAYLLGLALEILGEETEAAPPSYEYLPTSPMLYQLNEVISHHNKKKSIRTTINGTKKRDRHKTVQYEPFKEGGKGAYSIKETNEREGQTLITTVTNPEKMRGKGVKKCLAFLLAQSNAQNFAPEIGFALQELVDRGMYSSIESARISIKKALDALQTIQFGGTLKKGNRTIQQEAGILYYHYSIKNNYVYVSVNEKFNIEVIAPYFALIPIFSYALSNGYAFDLCEHIFMQARQNYDEIKKSGSFNIGFKRIRDLLVLPYGDEEEYTGENAKKFKPKQYVIDPILTAIKDIQNGAENNGNRNFTINAVYNENYSNLEDWLEGYIKITFSGEVLDYLSNLAKREAEVRKLSKARKSKKIQGAGI